MTLPDVPPAPPAGHHAFPPAWQPYGPTPGTDGFAIAFAAVSAGTAFVTGVEQAAEFFCLG